MYIQVHCISCYRLGLDREPIFSAAGIIRIHKEELQLMKKKLAMALLLPSLIAGTVSWGSDFAFAAKNDAVIEKSVNFRTSHPWRAIAFVICRRANTWKSCSG